MGPIIGKISDHYTCAVSHETKHSTHVKSLTKEFERVPISLPILLAYLPCEGSCEGWHYITSDNWCLSQLRSPHFKLDNVQVNCHIADTMQDRTRRAKDRAGSTGQMWHCVGNGTM